MQTFVLAVLFGAALVYGMYVARHACKSDDMALRRDGKGLSHEL
jgi:hypothetical protein